MTACSADGKSIRYAREAERMETSSLIMEDNFLSKSQ